MAISLQVLSNGVWPTPLAANTFFVGPVVGQECKISLNAAGGTGPYTYTVGAGTLPSGLTIFKDTRFNAGIIRDFIQGTPVSQGPYLNPNIGYPTYAGLTKFQLFNFTVHIEDSLGATADIPCAMFVYEKQAMSMCFPPFVFGQAYNFQLSSDYVNDVFAYINNHFSLSLSPKIPYELFLRPGFFQNNILIADGISLSSSGLLSAPVETLYPSLAFPASRSCLVWIEIKDITNTFQVQGQPVMYVDPEYIVYPLVTNLVVGTPATVDWETNIGTDNRFLTLISGALPAGITIVTTSSSDFEGTPTTSGIYSFVFQGQMAYGLTSQANGKIIVTGNGSACDCAEDLTYLKTYL